MEAGEPGTGMDGMLSFEDSLAPFKRGTMFMTYSKQETSKKKLDCEKLLHDCRRILVNGVKNITGTKTRWEMLGPWHFLADHVFTRKNRARDKDIGA